eukprot:385618_1
MSSNRVPRAAALKAKQRVKVQSDGKNELRMIHRGEIRLSEYAYVNPDANGRVLMQHRRSKFSCGYTKDASITYDEAVKAKNLYLKKTANGILEPRNDWYRKDLEDEYGIEYAQKAEFAVFECPGATAAELYIQLITSASTQSVWRNHALTIPDDQLKRKVREGLVAGFDGTNGTNIFGSGGIMIAAYKWTGRDNEYVTDSNCTIFFLIGNQQEDADIAKLVFANEMKKLTQIRKINKISFEDLKHRTHTLDFSEVII